MIIKKNSRYVKMIAKCYSSNYDMTILGVSPLNVFLWIVSLN